MDFPDPSELRSRNKSGREEFVQALLAILIVGGPAPRWNSSVRPSAVGRQFLIDLARTAGTRLDPAAEMSFVNEFELPRRHDAKSAGWPDFGVISGNELVVIELKTEARSHRRGQLAHYAELGAVHHPHLNRSLIYVTPPLLPSAVLDDVSTAHVLWEDVADLVRTHWTSRPPDERRVADYLIAILTDLGETWVAGGELRPRIRTSEPELIRIASEVAADGRQRAVDVEWASGEEMEHARLAIRDTLVDRGSPVRPWIWSKATSGGSALSEQGRLTGFELRFSRYAR